MTTAPLRTALPVSAVLVVRDGARWLPDTLDAVAAQTQPPQRLVIIDLASTDGSVDIASDHAAVRRVVPEVTVRSLSTVVGYAAAVAEGVAELGEPQPVGPEWLWLLHDDGAPEPRVLELLADAVRRSPSVGVAGPKVVRWEDPRIFVENGIQLTRAGRRISLPRPGERDQGQYDSRSDVIAVATNGMLVRRDVFDELGGFDAGFGPLGMDVWGRMPRRRSGGHPSSACGSPSARSCPSSGSCCSSVPDMPGPSWGMCPHSSTRALSCPLVGGSVGRVGSPRRTFMGCSSVLERRSGIPGILSRGPSPRPGRWNGGLRRPWAPSSRARWPRRPRISLRRRPGWSAGR